MNEKACQPECNKEGRWLIQVEMPSAELTACLHRIKVKDAVSSVDENNTPEKGGQIIMKKVVER